MKTNEMNDFIERFEPFTSFNTVVVKSFVSLMPLIKRVSMTVAEVDEIGELDAGAGATCDVLTGDAADCMVVSTCRWCVGGVNRRADGMSRDAFKIGVESVSAGVAGCVTACLLSGVLGTAFTDDACR